MIHSFGPFFGNSASGKATSGKTGRKGRQTINTRLEVERLEVREVLSAAQLYTIGAGSYDLAQTFQLHSNPGATKVIYLDFDGYTTGDVYGSDWDNLTSPAWDYSGNGAAFTDTERQIIQKIWARVAEDYAPFGVDVTTQDPGVEALRKSGSTDQAYGIRVVITGDDTPAPGSGGVAYIGSFNFSTDTPAYVFNVSEKSVAEAISHEVGHSLGLGHDGTATLGYYSGQGSGTTSWGPIMGASYNVNVTQFSKGEYNGANNTQDDLAIITSQNGFTYLSDDYGNSQQTAFAIATPGSSVVTTTYGIIERNTDADWFSFYANAGALSIKVDPATLGPNLAIKAEIYNASGTLLTTVNSATALNAVINFTLPSAGQYFLKIQGAGRGDPATNGFSNYASLGNYRITGTIAAYTGSGGTTNSPPVANADSATTVAGTPIAINVLANDTDANSDPLTLTRVTNVVGGTAVISNNQVLFTPATGFTGTASFNYGVSDGNGGTATGSASVTVTAPPTNNTYTFTNNTDVTISSSSAVTVTSSIVVSGLTGTLQDVDVQLNIRHTWDSDLQITLIAPDGTRVQLFNRHGGSGDNLLNTTFDSAATTSISNAAAPFTGTFKPYQTLNVLNGKAPNGTWKLEIKDLYRLDGGYLDNWSVVLKTGAANIAKIDAPAQVAAALQSAPNFSNVFSNFFNSFQQNINSINVPPALQTQFNNAITQIQTFATQISSHFNTIVSSAHQTPTFTQATANFQNTVNQMFSHFSASLDAIEAVLEDDLPWQW